MPTTAYREAAANVTLADLMSALGAPSKAETIVHAGGKRNYPDVRTERADLHVVIYAFIHTDNIAARVAQLFGVSAGPIYSGF